MSQENVELVRRAYVAFAEHGIEATVPFNAPDVVIHALPDWPDDPVYHGHDGLRKLAKAWAEYVGDFGFEVHELHDADNSVVALIEMTGGRRGPWLR